MPYVLSNGMTRAEYGDAFGEIVGYCSVHRQYVETSCSECDADDEKDMVDACS